MSELDTYIKQTRRCVDQGFYYPALAMALALPDICAAVAGMKRKPVSGTSNGSPKSVR